MDREVVHMCPAWSFQCPECSHTTFIEAPISTGPDGEPMMALDEIVQCGDCGQEYKADYGNADIGEEEE